MKSLNLRLAALVFSAAALILVAPRFTWSQAPETKKQDTDINKPFQNPDVDSFVKRFESESREVFKNRAAIVSALHLKKGMHVADIGAGTGAFTRLMAEQVGSEGVVYAVDISEPFLKHIAEDAKKNGMSQIKTIRATQDSSNLPENDVDLVYICDVYHHIEKPARTLEALHRSLKANGELFMVEFDRVEGKSSDFVRKHIRAEKSVFIAEIKAAGFEPVTVTESIPLKENFIARFRKIEKRAASNGPLKPATQSIPKAKEAK